MAGEEPVITRHLPRDQRSPFSRKFYKRARLGTNLVVGGVVLSCLLYDWDTYLGTDQHVFKGIRPAVRHTLDWLWGVDKAAPPSQSKPSQTPSEARA